MWKERPHPVSHLRRPVEEYEHTPIYPGYDITSGLRNPYRKPEDLLEYFEWKPLTRDFINWVYSEDYIIVYYPELLRGKAFVADYKREIGLLRNVSLKESNFSLAHELVHIASPPTSWGEQMESEGKYFEEVIDKIAEPLAENLDFIYYARWMLTRPNYTSRNFPDNSTHEASSKWKQFQFSF